MSTIKRAEIVANRSIASTERRTSVAMATGSDFLSRDRGNKLMTDDCLMCELLMRGGSTRSLRKDKADFFVPQAS